MENNRMGIAEVREIAKLASDFADALDRVAAPPQLKFAVVPMLFDHICEQYGLPKDEMRKMLYNMTKAVQESLGDMYS